MTSEDIKHQLIRPRAERAVWKWRWSSWAPVPNMPTVSMNVKQHSANAKGGDDPRRTAMALSTGPCRLSEIEADWFSLWPVVWRRIWVCSTSDYVRPGVRPDSLTWVVKRGGVERGCHCPGVVLDWMAGLGFDGVACGGHCLQFSTSCSSCFGNFVFRKQLFTK